MDWMETYEAFREVADAQQSFLLFVKTDHCSVCDGLYPQVTALQSQYPLPFYAVNASRSPEIAGQLSLFSAPVVLLFHEGNEYARFARFVRLDELKRRMAELMERGERD